MVFHEMLDQMQKLCLKKNIDNAATASIFAERDLMNSVASAVMCGKLAKAGSGDGYSSKQKNVFLLILMILLLRFRVKRCALPRAVR